jgi:hypothetical protein
MGCSLPAYLKLVKFFALFTIAMFISNMYYLIFKILFRITAIFHGSFGTGKAMAAEILANELEFDLLQIYLLMAMSKYMGETSSCGESQDRWR